MGGDKGKAIALARRHLLIEVAWNPTPLKNTDEVLM